MWKNIWTKQIKSVQIKGYSTVEVETDGTNITAIKIVSDGVNVINAGGTKDIYVDSYGKACNLTILKENIKIETPRTISRRILYSMTVVQ